MFYIHVLLQGLPERGLISVQRCKKGGVCELVKKLLKTNYLYHYFCRVLLILLLLLLLLLSLLLLSFAVYFATVSSFEIGLPIPILNRQKSFDPHSLMMLFKPLCPPLLPPFFSLICPTLRSRSS